MSEPKWTPGPWEAQGVSVKQSGASWSEGGIAVVVSDHPWDDAHLIAAAPDLYEACEEALNVLEARGTKLAAERMAVRMLERALRKARGEE